MFLEIRMLQHLGPGHLEEEGLLFNNGVICSEWASLRDHLHAPSRHIDASGLENLFQMCPEKVVCRGDALVHLQVDAKKLWYKVLAANLDTELLVLQLLSNMVSFFVCS